MLFPTATFAIFFLVVLPLSWLLMPSAHRWRPFIIAASYVFYGWWDWRFVFLLAGCTLWNQVLAVRICAERPAGAAPGAAAPRARGRPRRARLLQVLRLLRLARATTWPRSSGLDLPLSLRRSCCRSASRSTRSWRSATSSTSTAATSQPTTLEKFAVYLSFFPHLVAGPIVRPGELIPQLETPRDPRRVDTSRAFYLIATGLFKKVVIANYLASHIVDQVFAAPGQHSSLEILDRRLRLRRADLRRLLRLHRHRHRHRAPARLQVPAELRLALRGRLASRTSGGAGT